MNKIINPKRVVNEFNAFYDFITTECGGISVFDGHNGGYHTEKSGDAIESIRIGDVPQEKDEKYFSLSYEKVERAWEMYFLRGDMTSAQSAIEPCLVKNIRTGKMESWGKYPGGIMIPKHKHALAFSGLPALLDEAFEVWYAFRTEKLHYCDLIGFAKLRPENPYLQKMTKFFCSEHDFNMDDCDWYSIFILSQPHDFLLKIMGVFYIWEIYIWKTIVLV